MTNNPTDQLVILRAQYAAATDPAVRDALAVALAALEAQIKASRDIATGGATMPSAMLISVWGCLPTH